MVVAPLKFDVLKTIAYKLFEEMSFTLNSTIRTHPEPHIHVKNSFSRNIKTRLRMYKVLLFKFTRHLCKGFYLPRELFIV